MITGKDIAVLFLYWNLLGVSLLAIIGVLYRIAGLLVKP